MATRIYTIEIRVDFKNEENFPIFQQAVQQAAHMLYAQSDLLGEVIKPEMVVYSHDYFTGHKDIGLFDNDILKGVKAISSHDGAVSDNAATERLLTKPAAASDATPSPPVAQDDTGFLSEEMLAALK